MKTNHIGQRFGRLVVIGEADSTPDWKARWLCKCDCGAEKIIKGNELRNGDTKSCGCRLKEMRKTMNRTHGASTVPGASNWYAMVQRCEHPNAVGYDAYGGSGIQVCECIRVSIWNLIFVAGDKPSRKHSIDRFPDKKGNYSCGFCHHCERMGWKKNVRWATQKQQAQNTNRNHDLTFNGVTMCLTEWARRAGIKAESFRARLRRGQNPFIKVIHSPITIGGITRAAREWSVLTGIHRTTIEWRVKNGRNPLTPVSA